MLKNKFLKAISGDFKIKLLSILLAFAMWVFVMEEINPITVRSIKNAQISEITNIEEIENGGLTLSYNQNLTANIDFRAKRSILADFIREEPKITGTIQNPKRGLNSMILSIEVPNTIKYSFDPSIIQVNLEESVIEEREVVYETMGSPLQGFEAIKTSLSEEKIKIEGPRSQVNKVNKLLARIDLNNVKKDFETRVKVLPVDDKGEEVPGIKVSDYYVIANVKVSAFKEVPLKFDLIDNEDNVIENLVFDLEEKSMKIYGEKDYIDKIEYIYTEDLKLEDLNNNFSDEYFIDIQNINDINFEKNQVRVVVKDDLTDYTFEYDKNNILFTDESTKEEILNVLPNKIKLIFKTSPGYDVSLDNIKLTIDNSYIKNEYKIDFKINIPVLNVKINPNKIVF